MVPEFVEYVKNSVCHSPMDQSLKGVFTLMNLSSQSINTDKYVKDMIPTQWLIGTQQDAHEFLGHILTNAYHSQIQNLFEVQFNESVICNSQVCNQRDCSSRYDSNLFLNLPLEETELAQSIDYLIHKYQSAEELSDYTCGKDEELVCKQTGNCYKSQKI